MKISSPAFERNKEVILEALREALPAQGTVLEIASGSGQHAAYFARHLPRINWQPSELSNEVRSIAAWRDEYQLPNLLPPLTLDIDAAPWPVPDVASVEAVVCINAIHIIAWQSVCNLIQGTAELMKNGGVFFVYGPYHYRGCALAPSNLEFDRWLKTRDSVSGIREFESVNTLASAHGLQLVKDQAMPANNRAIWWQRTPLVST